MGFQLFNFECHTCGKTFEQLVGRDEEAVCACGSADTKRCLSALKTFTVIRATTRTSGPYKAGTIHKYHRPREKISVSVPR